MPRILLTGATDGIGKQTALDLAAHGAELLLHGRNPDKLAAVQREARDASQGQSIDTLQADLASLDAVRAMAHTVLESNAPIDVLLNNAGVYMNQRRLSADGFELTLAVNHLAPFLLTHLLLDRIAQSDDGRILNVSSIAHSRGQIHFDNLHFEHHFSPYDAYAQSKLANVLFTRALAPRLPHNVVTHALHPGVVSTKLLTEGFGMRGPDSLSEGAATSVHLALAPEIPQQNGLYYVRKRPTPVAPHATEPHLIERFYALSCELTGATPRPLA